MQDAHPTRVRGRGEASWELQRAGQVGDVGSSWAQATTSRRRAGARADRLEARADGLEARADGGTSRAEGWGRAWTSQA